MWCVWKCLRPQAVGLRGGGLKTLPQKDPKAFSLFCLLCDRCICVTDETTQSWNGPLGRDLNAHPVLTLAMGWLLPTGSWTSLCNERTRIYNYILSRSHEFCVCSCLSYLIKKLRSGFIVAHVRAGSPSPIWTALSGKQRALLIQQDGKWLRAHLELLWLAHEGCCEFSAWWSITGSWNQVTHVISHHQPWSSCLIKSLILLNTILSFWRMSHQDVTAWRL